MREYACNAGDPSSIPGSGRSGEGIGCLLQYSWASLVAQLVKNLPALQETWLWSLGFEDPWRRERLPLQYSGLENSMDYTVHGVTKSRTRLSDFHFLSLWWENARWIVHSFTYSPFWTLSFLRAHHFLLFLPYLTKSCRSYLLNICGYFLFLLNVVSTFLCLLIHSSHPTYCPLFRMIICCVKSLKNQTKPKGTSCG